MIVHPRMVVVGHVIILSKVIVIALNDCGGVHAIDVIALRIELDEAMEAVIDKSEEISHAQKGLKVDPENKGWRTSEYQQRHSSAPISNHSSTKGVVLASQIVGFEEVHRGNTRCVQEDSVYVKHELRDACSVQIPLVEGIPNASIKAVVDGNM